MGVVMSERCGLIYVMVLLKNGRTTEILKFVEEDLVLRVSTDTKPTNRKRSLVICLSLYTVFVYCYLDWLIIHVIIIVLLKK